MSEFGQQIDVDYEVWWEFEGKFTQSPIGDRLHFYGVDLETAQQFAERMDKTSEPGVRHFVVEVVSVRSEYGA
jgi:hypothetical protein